MKRCFSLLILVLVVVGGAPSASCSVDMRSMPCCAPSSHCSAAGLNTSSCCSIRVPADRDESADRSGVAFKSTRTPAVAGILHAAPAAVGDVLPSTPDSLGASPPNSKIARYLLSGSLLR